MPSPDISETPGARPPGIRYRPHGSDRWTRVERRGTGSDELADFPVLVADLCMARRSRCRWFQWSGPVDPGVPTAHVRRGDKLWDVCLPPVDSTPVRVGLSSVRVSITRPSRSA